MTAHADASCSTPTLKDCNPPNPKMKKLGFAIGLMLFVLTQAFPAPVGLAPEGWVVAGLAAWMVVWWMTEAAPLSITALLPVVVLPLMEVVSLSDIVQPYANPVIFLFLGGFIIAIAIQQCNLHRRIALGIVSLIGTKPDRVIGGFMVAAAFLSMWISNTATMLMMLPIAFSIIALMKKNDSDGNPCDTQAFATCLLLALAFSSSVGGAGTIIGTPPNAIMSGFMQQSYGLEIGFVQWMMVGVPLVVIMVTTMWFVMTKFLFTLPKEDGSQTRELFKAEIKKLGSMSRAEKTVAIIAIATATLWLTHPFISQVIPFTFNDALIAMIGALALFFIPVNRREHRFVLSWAETEKHLPWGVLILFGGGLALAGAFESSGLATWIGTQFEGAAGLPPLVVLIAVVTVLMVTTTLMSNVASINIFLPIIVPMAVGMEMHPLFLAIPATMAASCAFMLPVSTANNAIAFGTGEVTIAQMARAGFWLNLIALPVLVALTYLLVLPVFGVEMGTVPDWAQ